MARLAVFNPAVRTLDESVVRAMMAERLGFKSVWTTQLPDARDASLVLAAYANATERVTLGTGVLPIYTRHPTATAQMAATLDELSGGRFILGIGVSHKVTVEGISCSSCHLVEKLTDDAKKIPSYQLSLDKTMYGPFKDAEDNMVHNSFASKLYKGANFCTSCHFEKLRDNRSPRRCAII